MAITCNLDCNKELDIIFKGTTPTFNFNVCLDTSLVDIENMHIVFTSGRTIVDKSGNDIVLSKETPNNMNDGDLWYQILS